MPRAAAVGPILGAALLWAGSGGAGQARPLTYCVGGYRGQPPGIHETACDAGPVRAQHDRWHHHTFFRKDGLCYDCWDEVDSSCDRDFLRRNPGFTRVRRPPEECGLQDNAGVIIDHIIDGRPDPAVDRPSLLTPEAHAGDEGGPLDAGQEATLTGTVRDPAGGLRPLEGGRFRIEAPDGQATEVAGELQPDGVTVRARAPLPDADSVHITFLPDLPPLAPGEQLQPGERGQALSLRRLPALALPPLLDFGALPAGALPRDHCQPLDLRASRHAAASPLVLSLSGLGACEARPQLATLGPGGEIQALRSLEAGSGGLRVEAAGDSLLFCLLAPFCSGEVAPPGAVLRVTPESHPDRAAEVGLRWQVAGQGWLACHGWWLWPTLAGLAAAWVVAGFVRPHRFSAGSSIRLAGSLKGLKRASSTDLRGCSGSRPGFYRDARLGIHADGSVNGRTRGAVALLRASRDGVVLEPRGSLEVYHPRKNQWLPPEAQEPGQPLLPSPHTTYRSGELYFQVEPG